MAAVAAAVALVLLLSGLRRGIGEQVTVYLDHQPPVLVGLAGARNFMAQTSVLPETLGGRIESVPGVAAATPIAEQFAMLRLHGRRVLALLIGSEPGKAGGPWKLAAGHAPAGPRELALDEVLASEHGLRIGSALFYRGARLRVVGLSSGTNGFMTPLAFATRETLNALSRQPRTATFFLVRPAHGVMPEALAERIDREVAGVSALTRAEAAANDRSLFTRALNGMLLPMVVIAFAVAILVVGLAVYGSTAERSREYAIATALLLVLALRAIFAGMENRLTAHIEGTGADVIVAQRGVQTMQMTESALPERTVRVVAAVPGVAAARPILYVPATVEHGLERGLVYLIGDDAGGAPIPLADGSRPGPDEIVLDRALVERLGAPGRDDRARVQSRVSRLGRGERVHADHELLRLRPPAGSGPDAAQRWRRQLRPRRCPPGSRRRRARQADQCLAPRRHRQHARGLRPARAWGGGRHVDRHRAGDDPRRLRDRRRRRRARRLRAALSQLRDYAVLRALGLEARRALALAAAQVGATVAAGFLLALALVWALAGILPALSPALALSIEPGDVAQALAVAAAVALGAAAFPVIRVSRVDPASVFRR